MNYSTKGEGFKACLKEGQKAEIRIINEFLIAGWLVQLASNKDRYDFWVYNTRPYFIESKNEDNQTGTGNICIELYQGVDKHPSGLKTTESNLYIHTLKEKVILYKTRDMRLYITKNWNFLKHEVKDFPKADNDNGGLIRPIDKFKDFWWFDYCDFKDLTKSKIFDEEN